MKKVRVRIGPAGWTLIELLVVLAVIGVLTGLLLPAVQQVREAARRTACANNLRQIGVALQNHHAALGHFPMGGMEWRGADPSKRQLAWSAFLLPWIEQQQVYDHIDFEKPFDAPENASAAATIIATYICPSGPRGPTLVDGRGPADYGGIYGERISGPNQPPKGVMLYDRTIAASDILDGVAYTLVVSEDTGWPDGQWINGRNIFDQAFAINQAPDFENDIRSHHPLGANGCFCDGHVAFLPETMDMDVLAAICTRAGREVRHVW